MQTRVRRALKFPAHRGRWTVLSLLCALLALVCLALFAALRAEKASAREAYVELRKTVAAEPSPVEEKPAEEPEAPPGPDIDLSAMADVEDFVFWLDIPGVHVSYPVMQGGDNAYYLNHLPDGTRNRAGSLFLDWRAEGGADAVNAVVYGHNMKDETMFSNLIAYQDADFLAAHREIWLLTAGEARWYEVACAHVVKATADCYRLDSAAPCAGMEEAALGAERVLTLSTCTGWPRDERLVVHAVPMQP